MDTEKDEAMPEKRAFVEWARLKGHIPPALSGLGVRRLSRRGQLLTLAAPIGMAVQHRLEGEAVKREPIKLHKGPDYRVVRTQIRHPETGRKVPENWLMTEAEYDEAVVRAYSVTLGESPRRKAGE